MSRYETNLASEFYVMAALYRWGADAALSLGNKKSVDITVIRGENEVVTIDVKGVAGKYDWPADNIPETPKDRHFLVFVSFEGKFDDPTELPGIWVVPHAEVKSLINPYKGRSNVSRRKMLEAGAKYKDRWDLIVPKGEAEHAT